MHAAAVPVVATIYRAVSNVINSLGTQFQGGTNFKRVVLVDFPHAGMASLGLVTNFADVYQLVQFAQTFLDSFPVESASVPRLHC